MDRRKFFSVTGAGAAVPSENPILGFAMGNRIGS